jgi:hypothetical protein
MKSVRKTKAGKSKAKKGRKRKVQKASANKSSLKPKNDKQLRSLINEIDVPSLHDDDIATILMHCNSVLDFRRSIGGVKRSLRGASSGRCYRKAGDSSEVSIYEGFFKVGTMSEESAKAQGIPRCG